MVSEPWKARVRVLPRSQLRQPIFIFGILYLHQTTSADRKILWQRCFRPATPPLESPWSDLPTGGNIFARRLPTRPHASGFLSAAATTRRLVAYIPATPFSQPGRPRRSLLAPWFLHLRLASMIFYLFSL